MPTEPAPKNKKPGIWGMLKTGWQHAQTELKKTGADFSRTALNSVVDSKVSQSAGAEMIKIGIIDSVKEITSKANTLVTQGNEMLHKENAKAKSYDVIRASLAPPKDKPQDNFIKVIFKNIIARLLDAGAGVGGYIGAAFVNKAVNPPEGEKVDQKVAQNMFANFMATVLGRNKQDSAAKPVV